MLILRKLKGAIDQLNHLAGNLTIIQEMSETILAKALKAEIILANKQKRDSGLDAERVGLTTEAMMLLAKIVAGSEITFLDVSGSIKKKNAVKFIETLAPTKTLQELYIRDAAIGEHSEQFAKAINNILTLQKLCIWENNIMGQGAIQFCQTISSSKLSELYMSEPDVRHSPQGSVLTGIAKALSNSKISKLGLLGFNPGTIDETREAAKFFALISSLEEVEVADSLTQIFTINRIAPLPEVLTNLIISYLSFEDITF